MENLEVVFKEIIKGCIGPESEHYTLKWEFNIFK